MEDEKLTTISLGEYEHLKEIKQERLNELQNEIHDLESQILFEKINSIIRYAISV